MSRNLRSQRLVLDGFTDGSSAKLPNSNPPSTQGVSRRRLPSEFHESSPVSQKRLKSSQFSSQFLPALIDPSQSAAYLAELSDDDDFTVLPSELPCPTELQLTNEDSQRANTGCNNKSLGRLIIAGSIGI
jgi:hypothetical protein